MLFRSGLATDAISGFSSQYQTAWLEHMRHKLGLMTEQPEDEQLIRDLLDLMQAGQADFTSTFRTLSHAANNLTDENFTTLFPDTSAIHDWLNAWHLRLSQETASPAEREKAMLAVNPVYIPRNHRIEAVIRAAVDADDFAPFEELHSVLSRPFTENAAFDAYKTPAQIHERVLRTFCGT